MLTPLAIKALRNLKAGRPAFNTTLLYAGRAAKKHRQQALEDLYKFGFIKRRRNGGPIVTSRGRAFLVDLPDILKSRFMYERRLAYAERYGMPVGVIKSRLCHLRATEKKHALENQTPDQKSTQVQTSPSSPKEEHRRY